MSGTEYNGPSSKIKLHIYSGIPKKKHIGEQTVVIKSAVPVQRRKRVPWSSEEEEALIKGIKEFGVGRWKDILEKYRDKFNECRRYIDLSDKYKVLNKMGSYHYTTKINFTEVNDNGEEISNALGERRVYPARFPHTAAIKAGICRLSGGVKEIIVNIQGERNGVVSRHRYHVSHVRSRLCARKIAAEVVKRHDQERNGE